MDEAQRLALAHCVLTHHGPDAAPGRRFGSPEALALYRLNALDATVKGALEHGLNLRDVGSGTMSTTQFAPQLRPLSVGEVLDASFKIVRQSFGTLAMCVLVVAVPLNIVDHADHGVDEREPVRPRLRRRRRRRSAPAPSSPDRCWRPILELVLTSLATAACFRAVSGTYLGERPTVGGSLAFAASRLLPLIWLSILYVLGLIPAFILLVIPGIWLAVAWSVSYPGAAVRGHRPGRGARALVRLVKGRWWPTFGALLVMYLS